MEAIEFDANVFGGEPPVNRMRVIIRPNPEAAADLVAQIVAGELRANPGLVMGLATGCTMESVYARIIQMHHEEGLDFSASRTFNLDEYVGLPASHPNSYRHYMNRHLFLKVNIDLRNTHLPDGMAENLEAECARYEELIARSGGIDLQLLGIGLNGHIGFNEPPAEFTSRTAVKALSEVTRRQNAALFDSRDQMPASAITMGVGTILGSRRCVLLAVGETKAEIVTKAAEGPISGLVPASALQKHSECFFILDQAAATGFGIPPSDAEFPGPSRAQEGEVSGELLTPGSNTILRPN